MARQPTKSIVVLDLDNTLFDWVDIWYHSFRALFDGVAARTGVSEEQLTREFKQIHRRHGTTEYAFSLQELPCLQERYAVSEIANAFDEEVRAFREARRQRMRLYPGVTSTLAELKLRGCLLVAYTESMAFYTAYRLRHLGLDVLLDFLYSPTDHDFPKHMTPEQVRRYPAAHYRLRRTLHRHTPPGEFKPNPVVLRDILADVGSRPEHALYVGDSKMKDVAMAQQAGVLDIWAEYGAAQYRPEYELLRAVTHWSDESVERERRVADDEPEYRITPTHSLKNGFFDLLKLQGVRFGAINSRQMWILSYISDSNPRPRPRIHGERLAASDFDHGLIVPNPLVPMPDADKPEPRDPDSEVAVAQEAAKREAARDAWRAVVDVQKHFNDICMALRSVAVTVLVGSIAAAAFVVKEQITLPVFGVPVPVGAFVALAGLFGWFAFYMMDRHWYHVFLRASGIQASRLESRWGMEMPEMLLSSTITEESRVMLFGMTFKSSLRLSLFYFLGALVLVGTLAGTWFARLPSRNSTALPAPTTAAQPIPANPSSPIP